MQFIATIAIYIFAAFAEIAGCFAFWAWSRQDKNVLWLIPGVLSLIAFAWLLSKIDLEFAGKAYAAYGGIYIVATIFWLWAFEGQSPSRTDIAGAILCFAGMATILVGGMTR